jgi:predicted transcriptional regulator
MTIGEVKDILEAIVLTGGERMSEPVDTACGSDLMSDVLAFVKDNAVLITGLINPHVVRTSEMLDITCIVFSRGKLPSEEMLEMADEIGITVIASPMTTYTACGELYIHGLPGTKKKPKEV